MAGHAVGELAREPPARADLGRAAQHDTDARPIALDVVLRLARAAIHCAHLARERAGREVPRGGEPHLLVLRTRDAAQQARTGLASWCVTSLT